MKYKLINQKTKEEFLCDKVVIKECDYYVSDELNIRKAKYLFNPKYVNTLFLIKGVVKIQDSYRIDTEELS